MTGTTFEAGGRTRRIGALGVNTAAAERFPANTVAACFVNDARHPKPSNGVRIGLKLMIGTHNFRFADATPVRAFQAEDCYHWPRPSGLNGWAYGDVALVKVMTAANTPATGRAGYTGEYTVEVGDPGWWRRKGPLPTPTGRAGPTAARRGTPTPTSGSGWSGEGTRTSPARTCITTRRSRPTRAMQFG